MKEHKFVIVRTLKNHVSDYYGFATKGYNGGGIVPRLVSACKVADEINLKPYVGGMLAVELISSQTNGETLYPMTETVYFDRGIISDIEIHTEFAECRKQATQHTEETK